MPLCPSICTSWLTLTLIALAGACVGIVALVIVAMWQTFEDVEGLAPLPEPRVGEVAPPPGRCA